MSEFRVYVFRVYALVLQGLRRVSGFRVLKLGVLGRGGRRGWSLGFGDYCFQGLQVLQSGLSFVFSSLV